MDTAHQDTSGSDPINFALDDIKKQLCGEPTRAKTSTIKARLSVLAYLYDEMHGKSLFPRDFLDVAGKDISRPEMADPFAMSYLIKQKTKEAIALVDAQIHLLKNGALSDNLATTIIYDLSRKTLQIELFLTSGLKNHDH